MNCQKIHNLGEQLMNSTDQCLYWLTSSDNSEEIWTWSNRLF